MMERQYVWGMSLMVATVIFSGCSTEIGNLGEYKLSTLQKAMNMPSQKQLTNTKASKIIIMNIDDNNIGTAKNAQLGKGMAVHINKELAENKNVRVVKRVSSSNYEQIMNKEIKAAELAREIGEDVGAADYLVTGQISNASYSHEFSEGYYYDTDDGRKYSPPKIDYKACVQGTLKVFALPELKEKESKGFDKCETYSEEARSPSDAKRSNNSLVRKAGNNAMHAASFGLKNFFTKKGYIVEKRKKDDEVIIRVMLGSKQGAKHNEDVKIYTVENVTNPLTGETSKAGVLIGTGVISEKVTVADSWIVVDEIQEGKKLHLGDYIKIQYEQGWLDGVMH